MYKAMVYVLDIDIWLYCNVLYLFLFIYLFDCTAVVIVCYTSLAWQNKLMAYFHSLELTHVSFLTWHIFIYLVPKHTARFTLPYPFFITTFWWVPFKEIVCNLLIQVEMGNCQILLIVATYGQVIPFSLHLPLIYWWRECECECAMHT